MMHDTLFLFNQNLNSELVHHYEPKNNTYIKSTGRFFSINIRGISYKFSIPQGFGQRLLGSFRILRRLLRLDKSNAVFNYNRDGVVIVYRSKIFYYCLKNKTLKISGRLKNCRNVLHCGIAVIAEGIYLSEYGDNSKRDAVDILCSKDGGSSWFVIYTFPAGSIKHTHGVYYDPHEGRLWVPTGDFKGECFMISANLSFSDITIHGDGSQLWRAVGMFFTPDKVIWGMDSPLEISYLQSLDRKTQDLTQGQSFPGPIWYTKSLNDGISLLQTSVEIGPGVLENVSYIYASKDMENWFEVASFKKDFLPMRYFKWGVIAFADGEQESTDFCIFGEALKGLDGRSFSASVSLESQMDIHDG
jgi:hypothetical protein